MCSHTWRRNTLLGRSGGGGMYTHTLYIFINMSKHPSGCFKSKGFHHLSKENLWLLWISKDKPLSLNNEWNCRKHELIFRYSLPTLLLLYSLKVIWEVDWKYFWLHGSSKYNCGSWNFWLKLEEIKLLWSTTMAVCFCEMPAKTFGGTDRHFISKLQSAT